VRTSLVLSIILHIIVLSAVLFNFSTSTTLDANHRPVTVELVSPSDLSQMKAGKKDAAEKDAAQSAPLVEKKPEQPAPKAPDAKPVDKAAEKQAVPPPPPPKEVAKAEPPKPEPPKPEPPKPEPPKAAEPERKPEPEKKVAAAKPEPLPEPKREEGTKPEPKPEPKKAEPKPKKSDPKPEPKQEAKPEPKEQDKTPFRDRIADLLKHPAEEQKPQQQPAPPVQTKREFDPDRIQALLNRDPKAGAPATQEGPKEPWRKPSSLQDQAAGINEPAQPRETYGAPSGQNAKMSANEIDYFVSQISRCWTPPIGGLGADAIIVKLHILLNKDGTLAGPPTIKNSGSSPFFNAAADAAVRAVLQCQPYTMPEAKFGEWQSMNLNFNPRDMYGG
jgi:hypothetical protein